MEISQRLFGPGGFVSQRSDLHPSEPSARHYVREHRRELIEAGALLLHGKQWIVRPRVYEQAVFAIATRRARRAAGLEPQ